jgi:hypothetical protein
MGFQVGVLLTSCHWHCQIEYMTQALGLRDDILTRFVPFVPVPRSSGITPPKLACHVSILARGREGCRG